MVVLKSGAIDLLLPPPEDFVNEEGQSIRVSGDSIQVERRLVGGRALRRLRDLARGFDETDDELWAQAIEAQNSDFEQWLTKSLVEKRLLMPAEDDADKSHMQPQGNPLARVEPLDPAATAMRLRTPVVLRTTAQGFELHCPVGGPILTLNPQELVQISQLAAGNAPDLSKRPTRARDRFHKIVRVLTDEGILAPANELELKRGLSGEARMPTPEMPAEYPSPLRDLGDRVPIVTIAYDPLVLPLPAGLIYSAVRALADSDVLEFFDTEPRFARQSTDLSPIADRPVVYLFSDYVWNTGEIHDQAAEIKRTNPSAITIFGGPNVPKYDQDTKDYLATHPYIDVAVIGEGEITAVEVLTSIARSSTKDRLIADNLGEVAGVSYIDRDGNYVRTAARERMKNPSIVPSPYLEGIFESILPSLAGPIIETNRGCPYKCSFCDWGSATNSRIHSYDEDRVHAELRWIGENSLRGLFIADANFGIRKRDAAFAKTIAETKKRYGFPYSFSTNYAKNTVKYLREIIETLTDADILSSGTVSLQTMDAKTLETVDRENIKTEKYDALAMEFREAGLPVTVHLMIGLPGQTVDSMVNDLQECMDRDLIAYIYETELLTNSPMNSPEYRERHGVEADPAYAGLYVMRSRLKPRQLVVATESFSRDDYRMMERMRVGFVVGDTYGVFRHFLRYMRKHAQVREVDVLVQIVISVADNPNEYPSLANCLELMPTTMLVPVSWRLVSDDLRRIANRNWPDGDYRALDAALAAQEALLPAPGRRFPYEVKLDHDYVGWVDMVVEAKQTNGVADWVDHVPPLADLEPGTLLVDDPMNNNNLKIGDTDNGSSVRVWELVSPLARPVNS